MEQASPTLCSSTIGWSYPLQRVKNASTITKFAFIILLMLFAEAHLQASFEGTIRTSRLIAAVDALCGWARALGLWIANLIIDTMNSALMSLLDESLSPSVANAFPDQQSLAKDSHFVLAAPIIFAVLIWLQNIHKFIVDCQPFVTAEFDWGKTSATVPPKASDSQPAAEQPISIIQDMKSSLSYPQESPMAFTTCSPLLPTIAIKVTELEKKTSSTYTPELSRNHIRNIKPAISATTVLEPCQAPTRKQITTPSIVAALNRHVKFDESTLKACKRTPSLYIPKKNMSTNAVCTMRPF
jgi:hypothetical protein